jgi:non-ribosomal peptide synthetase component E (peptide arylation enzyme)
MQMLLTSFDKKRFEEFTRAGFWCNDTIYSLVAAHARDAAAKIATEGAFNKDGWFLTGDMGWIDAHGYLRVTGRKKDVIIRGGHNINAVKIETLASQCGAIESAVAVPVPDERLGEKMCLAVVFRSDKHSTPDEILEHLHQAGLSKFDMPEYFLSLKEMPQTASGKPRKRDIVRWIAAGRLHPTPVRWVSKKA